VTPVIFATVWTHHPHPAGSIAPLRSRGGPPPRDFLPSTSPHVCLSLSGCRCSWCSAPTRRTGASWRRGCSRARWCCTRASLRASPSSTSRPWRYASGRSRTSPPSAGASRYAPLPSGSGEREAHKPTKGFSSELPCFAHVSHTLTRCDRVTFWACEQ
jgi:hypothetical protein